VNVLTRTVLLGAATGLRTFMAAAWWSGSRPAGSRSVTSEAPIDRLLASDGVALGMRVAAAAELVGDKLPFAPDRISPGPLAARAVMGGLLGWTASAGRPRGRAIHCAAGAGAAVLAAYGGYWARRLITEAGAPDLPIAAAEDSIAVALAAAASR
jgi:uncharacterized membrane protein